MILCRPFWPSPNTTVTDLNPQFQIRLTVRESGSIVSCSLAGQPAFRMAAALVDSADIWPSNGVVRSDDRIGDASRIPRGSATGATGLDVPANQFRLQGTDVD